MSENWRYAQSSITGERHRRSHMLCQDRSAYREKGRRQAIALIDGTGKTDRNIIAGEKIADCVTEFLLEHFEQCIGQEESLFKFMLLRDVRRIIEELMLEFAAPKEEFASTIMALCIDHERGKYCAVHLGDGIIVCRREALHILSFPCNGLLPDQTWLTISEKALQKMKLLRGDIGSIREFALLTDGMYEEPVSMDNLPDILKNGKRDVATEDDRSIVRLICMG